MRDNANSADFQQDFESAICVKNSFRSVNHWNSSLEILVMSSQFHILCRHIRNYIRNVLRHQSRYMFNNTSIAARIRFAGEGGNLFGRQGTV